MPPLSSGGILGSFPQPNDATEESTTASPRVGGGILAPLDRWNPQSSGTGRGILAPLERLNNPADQTTPAWLQSAGSFAANNGSLTGSTAQPWDYSRPQKLSADWRQMPTPPSSRYPFLPQPAPSYLAAPQSDGADAGTVAPPLQHLESANYWGAGSAPLGAGSVRPARAFDLPPALQAPSWDSLPKDASASEFFPQRQSLSWGVPTPALQDSAAPISTDASADVPQAEPNGIRLAGMASSFPGIRPPIPPLPLPGTPEWTDHFIRGWLGLLNALRRTGRGGGGGRRGGDDDEDDCSKRLGEEMRRCYSRTDDYAHQDFLQACIKRAKDRWASCIANKGRAHPNEPKEWGPEDEEIWRNFGR
jgi:hypothetical protein